VNKPIRKIISDVYLWQNGMVMVFDLDGRQMIDYQGPIEEFREKILRDAPPWARFYSGSWRDVPRASPIARDEF
jgi:hypothetical protein